MIRLSGVGLHLLEQGEGPPLLLLHGLGSSGADWSRMLPSLGGFRVLMPDTRGHGQSEKPAGDYGVPLFAADLAELCDHLRLTRLHVVGLSMGGMIGFQLAVTRPDLVASLTVINSGPALVPTNLKMKAALALRLFLLRVFGPRVLAQKLAQALFPEPEQRALREEAAARIGANDPDAYLRATRGLIGWTVEERLAEIACPVLVVGSEHDYTPVSFKRAYTQKLKNARLEVLAGSRHFASFDAPEALTRLLTQFLAPLTQPRAAQAEVSS
jgi:pimeloyl-ACP methyl ester carboxylesterase